MIYMNILIGSALLGCALAKRNLVFMISDGFGMTSETMARSYMQQLDDKQPFASWSSILDSMLVGSIRTQSSSSLVTDSAAGATAFSCAQKTYNGAIGVDPQGRPCGTILEAAKQMGLGTGLVTTARITHATPASFAAHVENRNMEDLIALQLLARNSTTSQQVVDLMFGGGLCHFMPSQQGAQSCRLDNTNVWQMAQQLGYTTLETLEEFEQLSQNASLPILAAFSPSHMAYSIDRDETKQPALHQMARKALDILNYRSPNGFFLMIEGARIDMAGHDNDPAAHVQDIIEYWKTIAQVQEFVRENPDTLLVSTSDHETGGLTLGIDPDYYWLPQTLQPIRHSAEYLCNHFLLSHSVSNKQQFIADTLMPEYLGIYNATEDEIQAVLDSLGSSTKPETDGNEEEANSRHKRCKRAVGGVVSRRAHVGWSTGGHSGADVGLYAFGNHANLIKGNMENTHLGSLLLDYLQLSTDSVTNALSSIETKQLKFSSLADEHN
ncbi:vacuolar alkaline phosphatase [Coemansia sp. RSA 1821]|nr:vacuolar alkaline phosphatase [Coemansia sp. RSA 1086]KAJ1749801.1 vacuolar alkaline phosphatase [Coemansia sp. RSA 1821]